jgi:hypothetical protein
MWLITTIGFFSVVRKRGESELTVRARAREDLEALASEYLPTLGPITVGGGTDYPFRARVAAETLARAVARLVGDIDYDNFKQAVALRQGPDRAHIYGDVWRTLLQLTTGTDS